MVRLTFECIIRNDKGVSTLRKKLTIYIIIFILFTLAFSTYVYALNISVKTTEESYSQKLNHLLKNDPDLKGAIAGISIRSASTGELLYEHNGDIRLRPASNLKLFTAAAALSVLGPDYKFSTEVLADQSINGNTLKGNLYLKGKGDPTLLQKDFDDLANKLNKMGVRTIEGNLIGDDSWYDDIRYSQDLPWTDEHTYYGAQVSALTAAPDKDYDSGTIILGVSPAKKAGEKALLTIHPNTDYVTIINETITTNSNGKKDITIERKHGTNRISIKGTIPINSSPEKEWIAVWGPTQYALNLFHSSLKKNNIEVTGNIQRGKAPKKAKVLLKDQSISLSKLLHPFMKLSNNGHAETLVKEMGKVLRNEGSWEEGLEVLEDELGELGIDTNSLVLRDGSGISHVNLVPANQVTKLLYVIQNKNWFDPFYTSLPVAGIEERMVGGTLRYRMNNPPLSGNVIAKTGTISTVSSISGYIQSLSGQELIFSILLNNLVDEDKGKELEDKIINALVAS
jgi:serine-type D-Ala-D-Ala carboxypeptidase/endopeptidase (penicillin-binding protein 4)